ncbi:hypothetical protein JST99_01815 [Candidatus Dependentiae bacterium]|nr:hypothetical protein [Candidatus Dependentiae bacterium]MCC7414720.1 hypothetical protein [Campylobacterota bacterium]
MLSIVCLALFSASSFLFSCDEHRSDKIQILSRYRETHHSTPYTRPSFLTQKKRAEYEQRRQELAGQALKKTATEKAQTTINQATAVAPSVLAKKEEADDRQDQSNKPLVAAHREFIYDGYTQRRGAPKRISIFCQGCDSRIMDYQKDGPGRLLRCYSDRCIDCPLSSADRTFTARTILSAPQLQCQHCASTIGKPMIYCGYGENRPAFHLNPRAFYIKN